MKAKPIILVVDDQPQNIDLLEAYLVPKGYEVVKAASGEEALEKLAGNQIDLILLDIMMPGIDGFEVIRRIRQNEQFQRLPIILVTAMRETESRIKGIEAGCDDFISKPFDKLELFARVQSLITVKAYNDLTINYQKELESEVTRRTRDLEKTFNNLRQEIIERKVAEYALKASENRYRRLFEASRDGILILDFETGLIVDSNSFLIEKLGLSPPQLLEKQIWELGFLKEVIPDADTFEKLKQKEYVRYEDLSLETITGQQIDVEFVSNVYEVDHQKVIQCNIRDVTEHKRADEELKNMHQQLIISGRLASIGELASGLAHELNNPLTGIIGISELIMEKEIPPDIKADLEIINKEAIRTAQVVRNLLTFARKQSMEKKPTDINVTLKDTLALRIYEQKQQNIQLITQLAPGLPPVLGCSSQLQQVFLNIIINAEYFMSQAHHGGTLTITTEMDNEEVKISMANDGDAIPAENLERIFDPFFTTKDVGQGTGLGLSISYGIITQHNGRIYAESKPGKGVTFIIELPAITMGAN